MGADVCEFELLAEQLLACAYSLRDSPSWSAFSRMLDAAAQVGAYLNEREGMYAWTDSRLHG